MQLNLRTRSVGIFVFTALAVAAAEPSYMGKWKFNPARSDLGQISVTYQQTAPGEMKFTVDNQSYTFKMDGKEYPAIFGTTAAWKQINDHTWETTNKLKGEVTGIDTTTLSADGKTMTVESKGKRVDGASFDDVTVFQRASGGPGLAGKWLTKNVKSSSPEVMEFSPNGADGLTWTSPAEGAECKSKFDGKDYPVTGARVPPGFTAVLKKTGANSFEMTSKKDGKPVYVSTFTVSADGKTLTEDGGAVGIKEKYKAVFDRQ